MVTAELFSALGDTTRLEIIRRLSSGRPHTITSVSEGLNMSRQGVRKHLRVLSDAQIIKLEPVGRDMRIELEKHALKQARQFLAELELQWDVRLEALRDFVEDV